MALPVAARRSLAFVTGLYSAVLLFATHYPRPEELVGRSLPPDKLLHFEAYTVLGFLVASTLIAYGHRETRSFVNLFAVLAVVAVLDEATQPLFGRAAEPLDWVFDAIGLAAGITAAVVSSWAWARGTRRA